MHTAADTVGRKRLCAQLHRMIQFTEDHMVDNSVIDILSAPNCFRIALTMSAAATSAGAVCSSETIFVPPPLALHEIGRRK